MTLKEFIEAFVLMWAVVDPIGTVPVFMAVTRKHPKKIKEHIAGLAIVISLGVLMIFVVFGQFLLEAMHVPLDAFQIAGGIVLFLFALSMIFGEGKPESELEMLRTQKDTAVFPLAVPSIASPGAMMAAVLMTDNHRFSFVEQVFVVLAILLVLFATWLLMIFSTKIFHYIGETGASILSRIMGLVLCSIAMSHILQGIQSFFHLG